MSPSPGDPAEPLDERATAILEEAAARLREARRVCAFTGAGMSAESGIATFRDAGGFWERYPLERFATPGGLLKTAMSDPQQLVAFLLDVLDPMAQAAPNEGHRALAELADKADVEVITQNIDGLHQRAGSERVHEVHGSLFQIVDKRGRPMRRLEKEDLDKIVAALRALKAGPDEKVRLLLPRLARAVAPLLGVSTTGLGHRPNVVLFGEALAEPDWEKAQRAADDCDVMLMVGTSGMVYPAAMLPEHVQSRGRTLIGVGPEAGEADLWLDGTAAGILPRLVEKV